MYKIIYTKKRFLTFNLYKLEPCRFHTIKKRHFLGIRLGNFFSPRSWTIFKNLIWDLIHHLHASLTISVKTFYELDEGGRERLVANIAVSLGTVAVPRIQTLAVEEFSKINCRFGRMLAEVLGVSASSIRQCSPTTAIHLWKCGK